MQLTMLVLKCIQAKATCTIVFLRCRKAELVALGEGGRLKGGATRNMSTSLEGQVDCNAALSTSYVIEWHVSDFSGYGKAACE